MIPLLIVLLSWIAIEIDVADAFYARGDPAHNDVKKLYWRAIGLKAHIAPDRRCARGGQKQEYQLDVERLEVRSLAAPYISIPPIRPIPPGAPCECFFVLRHFRDHDFRREQQARNRRQPSIVKYVRAVNLEKVRVNEKLVSNLEVA